MPTHSLRAARSSRILFCLATLFLFACSSVSATDVVLVEEHWELHVEGPDAARSAPQVTMVMSPTEDVEDDFFLVTLNHWSYPNFSAGGIQLQRWRSEDCLEVTNSSNSSAMHQETETVTWVQRISLVNGTLKFEVVSGSSQTWGTFGTDGELSLTVPTYLTRLNNYRPAVSIEQSGISYAGNRVASLVLKRLEWQTDDGEEHFLVAPIDIATDLDP